MKTFVWSFLVNVILGQYSMYYTSASNRTGIRYTHQLFRESVDIKLTYSSSSASQFLGIDECPKNMEEYMYKEFVKSPLFNRETIKTINKYIKLNPSLEPVLRPFLAFLRDYDIEPILRSKTDINVKKRLYSMFKIDLTSLIWEHEPLFYSYTACKAKFNGNIVKNWMGIEKDNHNIEHLLKGFVKYIRDYKDNSFTNFIYWNPEREIYKEFKNYLYIRANSRRLIY